MESDPYYSDSEDEYVPMGKRGVGPPPQSFYPPPKEYMAPPQPQPAGFMNGPPPPSYQGGPPQRFRGAPRGGFRGGRGVPVYGPGPMGPPRRGGGCRARPSPQRDMMPSRGRGRAPRERGAGVRGAPTRGGPSPRSLRNEQRQRGRGRSRPAPARLSAVDSMQNELDAAKNQYDALETKHNALEREMLQSQTSHAEREKSMQARYDKASKNAVALQKSEKAKLQNTMTTTQTELRDARKKVDALKQEMLQLQTSYAKRLKAMQTKHEKALSKAGVMEGTIQSKQAQIQVLLNEKAKLRHAFDDVSKERAASESERNALKRQLQSSRNTENDETQKSATVEAENQKLTQRTDTLVAENEALTRQVVETQKLVAENAELKLTATEQSSEIRALQTEREQRNHEAEEKKEEETDICKVRFAEWLTSTVKLKQYLPQFREHECNDIRMAQFLDEDTLHGIIGMSIAKKMHCKLILQQVEKLKKAQSQFSALLNRNPGLTRYISVFDEQSILTMAHLQKEIVGSKQALATLLRIQDGTQVNLVWSALFPLDAVNLNSNDNNNNDVKEPGGMVQYNEGQPSPQF